MRDEELEKAFIEAQKRWETEGSMGVSQDYQTRKERYFFFAGATFGTEATAGLYEESKVFKQHPE